MKWRVVLLFALTCTPFRAQFADLATTDDGGQLYFSSPMRLRGSSQNFYWKIFRYVGGKFQLFRSANRESPDPSPVLTSYFQLTAPQVSGDGTVVAYTAIALCTTLGSGCVPLPIDEGVIVGTRVQPVVGDGQIRLSGDKRYALIIRGSIDNPYPRLIDLATGTITLLVYAWIGDGRQAFADDGSVLLGTLTFMPKPVLWNPVSPQTLNLSRTPSLARVSRNKAKVVYEAVTAEQRTLVTYDVASGVETVLATGPGSPDQFPSYFYPWITNDGRTVLFMSTDAAGVRQAFLIGSDGANPRQLTHEPEGISEATVSGFGNLAYAATPLARLLRIDTASGAATELSPPSAQISYISTPAAGSLAELSGRGLDKTTAVYVNSISAPLYSASDTSVVFQIPWEVSTTTPAMFRVQDKLSSRFEAGLAASVAAISPSFLPFGTTYEEVPLALHQDWRSLVTPENPAVTGEVLHLYLTGMGPVTGTVQTGVPAPANGPLEKVLTPYTCELLFASNPTGLDTANVPILFAGLAPGFVGLYQVDVRVPPFPAGVRLETAELLCSPPFSVRTASQAFAHLPVASQPAQR